MSDPIIKFKLTPGAFEKAGQFAQWPERVLDAMVRAFDDQNQLTIAHISTKRMRGNNGKPFPAAQGILGIRTAHLVRSLRATKAQVVFGQIVSNIGTNIRYAGIHEFGGEIRRVQLAGSVRLRTDKSGNLIRQGRNGKLAVFAKASHKNFTNVPFAGGRRFSIRIPKRAPITRGIEDRVDDYSKAISAAIEGTKPI